MRNLVILMLSCLLLSACSEAMNIGNGPPLEEVTEGFSESMRWSDFPNAAIYLDLEARADFLDKFVEDDDLRVVESRILSINLAPDGKQADAIYQLKYYHLPSNRIKKWRWKQHWEMADDKNANPGIWLIKNDPPDLPWQKLKVP